MPTKARLKKLPIIAFCLATIVEGAGCSGGTIVSPVLGSSGPLSYSQQATEGVKALQLWYSQSSGLYAAPTGWWNAANAITVLSNYERVTGGKTYYSVLSNTFTAAQKTNVNFVNKYYDDDGWWALAWIDAYDLTGDARYLAMAEAIFSSMTGGWDTATCGGGEWWNTDRKYKNAIANELFLTVAAKLANRTTGSASTTYLNWAQQEWTWFKASGMINSQSLVNDGLTSTNPNACTNNGQKTWSYNQGVILGGLVELYQADKDPTLLPQAEAIANAAMTYLVTPNGVLTESVSGTDLPQFKGIFMRNLMALYSAVPSTQSAQYKTFAETNASSIWSNDQAPGVEFGGFWQGPFDSGDATRQASALDALIAAAAMQ
jgi:predicted alpha-1,6-mannanase (GH76 family)